ncbi:MAG: mechanosensitive ion channel family protein, partial [Burkholderiales bacterium]
LSLGEIDVSLSSVLSFVLAVWAAFLVSRFVRFVLNEEVFPRTHLSRGIPYAITRAIHFLIIALGFFIAMGVIGMEMTQFTILASAFTIGVGFGLQNIFNNFVSGLIVLFERPVQVGDVIQVDDAVGVVHRIGIRATIVRTASRSALIVPNGKLISDRVVNWTLSGRQRVIELPVSVVLQSDPAQVISVLEDMAKQHPSVLQNPPVQAILTRTGPDWMGFELRAAIAEVEAWTTVRSELAVSAIAALRTAGVTLR